MINKRIYPIGSEWLYIKLYCVPFFSDKILLYVGKYLKSLIDSKKIRIFFFVRYYDPAPHIRIRIKIISGNIEDIISKLYNTLPNGLVDDIKIESYNRELERYPIEIIDNIENIFYYNSISTLNVIECIDNYTLNDTDRWLLGLYNINKKLSNFQLSSEEKLEFAKQNSNGFSLEFNKSIGLINQIKKKFDLNRDKIYYTLSKNSYENVIYKVPSIDIEKILDRKLEKQEFNHLLSSIIHMDCNRLFRDQQRKHEYILYEFLYRYYKMRTFNKNINVEKKYYL